MKTFNYLSALIASLIIFFSASEAYSQSKREIREKKKAEEIQKLIDQKRFTFIVQTVQPMRGGTVFNQSTGFELTVKKDTLNSYLPYFGRAFTAPMNSTDSPLTFTTTEFSYTVEKKKKGSKDIIIIPKNRQQYSRRMLLNVSEQGYGTLQVTADNRDPITYTGYIAALKD